MKKLFVGQLSYSTTEETLRELFANYASVASIKIIMDPMSGRSRGFGFVELSDDTEATEAVSTLNGKSLDGRDIVVNEARPQAPRSGNGGGSFSRGGGDRGGKSDSFRGGKSSRHSGYSNNNRF